MAASSGCASSVYPEGTRLTPHTLPLLTRLAPCVHDSIQPDNSADLYRWYMHQGTWLARREPEPCACQHECIKPPALACHHQASMSQASCAIRRSTTVHAGAQLSVTALHCSCCETGVLCLLAACTCRTKASKQPTCNVSAIHSPCLPALRCCCGSRWACSASAAAETKQDQHTSSVVQDKADRSATAANLHMVCKAVDAQLLYKHRYPAPATIFPKMSVPEVRSQSNLNPAVQRCSA
jgi:hypothetical protein